MGIVQVSIGGVNMYSEYGLILATKDIGQPEVRTKRVDVPMHDGSIDMTTALSDTIKYADRTIKMEFLYLGDTCAKVVSDVAEFLHGQKLKIIFDDDLGFYYLGRMVIDSVKTEKQAIKITITATCDPFKYDVSDSADDWEWDTFDFETGIINECNFDVAGTLTYTLICRRDYAMPTFITSADMTMIYNGTTYNLPQGSHKLYELTLVKGENVLTFNGTGTVKISYVGRSL